MNYIYPTDPPMYDDGEGGYTSNPNSITFDVMNADPELRALEIIAILSRDLDAAALARITRYISDRWGQP